MENTIWSRHSYGTITDINELGEFRIKNDSGKEWSISKDIFQAEFKLADEYSTTQKVVKTELAKVVLANPKTAMTINFDKESKSKAKRTFNAEKKAQIKVLLDSVEKAQKDKKGVLEAAKIALEEMSDNPVQQIIQGDNRTIKGIHHGQMTDDNTRLSFEDMEFTFGNRTRQVDLRTIKFVIVDNVKYERK